MRFSRTTTFALPLAAALVGAPAPALAQECGEDPGLPRAVSLETCDATTLGDDVNQLLRAYAYSSCELAEAEQALPAMARNISSALSMLKDPKLTAHIEACAEAAEAPAGTDDEAGPGR